MKWFRREKPDYREKYEPPRKQPVLSPQPPITDPIPPDLVRIKRKQPQQTEKLPEPKKETDLQYLKIDNDAGKVLCSCGVGTAQMASVAEMNWWIATHLVEGCSKPEAPFEREFAAATAGSEN